MYAAHQAVIAMTAVGKTKDDRRPYLMVNGMKIRHPMARPTNAHDKEFAISWKEAPISFRIWAQNTGCMAMLRTGQHASRLTTSLDHLLTRLK